MLWEISGGQAVAPAPSGSGLGPVPGDTHVPAPSRYKISFSVTFDAVTRKGWVVAGSCERAYGGTGGWPG